MDIIQKEKIHMIGLIVKTKFTIYKKINIIINKIKQVIAKM